MYHRITRSFFVVACAMGLVTSACGGNDGPKNTILVTMTSPVTESYVSGEVTITVEVQGEVDRVALVVDGAVEQTLEAPPYTFTWNSDLTPEAMHTLEAVAYGPGGSQGRSGQALLMVDRTAPTLDLSSLVPPLLYTGAMNSVAFAGQDDAGIDALRLYADGALLDACDEASCAFDWDVSALPDGEVILTLEAEDVAGNVATHDVPVLVVNDGTPVAFIEAGGGAANWLIPEDWAVKDLDVKYHWVMPAGVTEVLAVLQWTQPEWQLALSIGTGGCPHDGVEIASDNGLGGQLLLPHAVSDLGLTEYEQVQWFIHMAAGYNLDMDSHVGESTRIAFVMVLY